MSNTTTAVALADVPNGYRGSERTAKMVRDQIRERFGLSVADLYDPSSNVRTFRSWLKLGYGVKKGEKALKSVTVIERKDKDGNVLATYPKIVYLFHQSQVEPLSKS
ncbi:MAG: hypothetical protein PHS79_03395 [Patescibacteria group bacterium]|nr:hypothetical protein [Patescibacteria group bacterium]